jgi:hypothetical protein
MRRTTVNRITRIVFLVWLIVTAVLLWKTLRRPAESVPEGEIARGQTVFALPLRSRS